MILTRNDLRRFLKIEKQKNSKQSYSYIRLMRICEYLSNSSGGGSFFKRLLFKVINKARTYKGYRLGYEVGLNVFDEGLKIIHTGALLVNGTARVGKNCTIIGSACIGGKGGSKAAHIGDNCELGVFSVVLGEIEIGNHCFIGAGSVVTKSFPEDNLSLAGVPAKIVNRL